VIAYLLVQQIEALLPFAFAFAAGAMLALVVIEIVPQAWRAGHHRLTASGVTVGAGLMIALAATLGV
jgi:ZIP family zinc transporter